MFPTSAERARPSSRGMLLWQIAAAAAVCAAIVFVAVQTSMNLRARGIASGFGYLRSPAAFEIPSGAIAFSSGDTFARALAVGLVNTARVASAATVVAAALGVAVGLARLSPFPPIAMAAHAFVNTVRNVPLLLQILCWSALLQRLPDAGAAWRPMAGVTVTNRGLMLVGHDVTPEFAALLAALSIYTAAFIAENVRGGILAVPSGQGEAAAALGLTRGDTLRAVLVPQALPVIVPPTVNQFVGLAKNSSLAAAIGYPDLMSITHATINQTGQAIEAIAVAMALYLAISLALAAVARAPFRRNHAP